MKHTSEVSNLHLRYVIIRDNFQLAIYNICGMYALKAEAN